MEAGSDIADFSRRDIALLDRTRPPSANRGHGSGRLSSTRGTALAGFCRRVRDAGFRVYAPIPSAHLMLATPRSKRWGISYQAARGQRARP